MPLRRLLPVLIACLVVLTGCGSDLAPAGLVVGHVDHESVVLGFHAPSAGTYDVFVTPRGGGEGLHLGAEAVAEHDHALVLGFRPLAPATEYACSVQDADGEVIARGGFRTAPAPGVPARVRLVLGSCAADDDHPVWSRITEEKPDALVLLGDTPYIDTTDLADQRRAHRAFLRIPTLARLVRTTPLWSTWDDHDYGVDNGDGSLLGKENARRAYSESRPQARYGEGDEGIYSRVRYGPVEVFLLDVRWFAGLEPAPGNQRERSLLGTAQRTWLESALRASDAPVKLLCCGMVWRDKGGRSQDDWASYRAERDRLFRFLGRERVPGCILVGGDVHACQHAVYEQTGAGYPLHELVISPLSERAWRGGDRQHPARRWGSVTPHVYLRLDIDTTGDDARLEASWRTAEGRELHALTLALATLRAR